MYFQTDPIHIPLSYELDCKYNFLHVHSRYLTVILIWQLLKNNGYVGRSTWKEDVDERSLDDVKRDGDIRVKSPANGNLYTERQNQRCVFICFAWLVRAKLNSVTKVEIKRFFFSFLGVWARSEFSGLNQDQILSNSFYEQMRKFFASSALNVLFRARQTKLDYTTLRIVRLWRNAA